VKDLAKKKLGQLTRALEAAQVAFRTEVEALAEKARVEILPYFKKHNLDYISGNGTWFITRPATDPRDREISVDDDDLPKNICDLLNLEVAHNDCLGFYIRDIKRGEW
jgi:hypothetical protein